MPQKCVAYGCKNARNNKARVSHKERENTTKLSFFRFPKKPEELRNAWIKAVKWKNWSPLPSSRLCSDHFAETEIDRTSLSSVRLRENAMPTIFPYFPPHLRTEKNQRRTRASKQNEDVNADDEDQVHNTDLDDKEGNADLDGSELETEGTLKPENESSNTTKTITNKQQSFSHLKDVNDQESEDKQVTKQRTILTVRSLGEVHNYSQTRIMFRSDEQMLVSKDCSPALQVSSQNASINNLVKEPQQSASKDVYLVFDSSASANNPKPTNTETLTFASISREPQLEWKLQSLNYKYKVVRKKLKIAQQRIRRLTKLKDKLKCELRSVKRDNRPEAAMERLENVTGITTQIIRRQLCKTSSAVEPLEYSEDLRRFSMILHSHSVKAYEFVRKSFGGCLPHPRTIVEWRKTTNSKLNISCEDSD